MAENTKIEWAHHTFNPWLGCTKVSPACDFCYAEAWAKRMGKPGLWAGDRQLTSDHNWRQPIKWNAALEGTGQRQRVFCASLADVFDNQVPVEWRERLWVLIAATPNLDWLLLTKRPVNIAKMLPADWGGGYPNVWLGTTVERQQEAAQRIPCLLMVPARIHFLSCEPLLGPVNLLDVATFRFRGAETLNALTGELSGMFGDYCSTRLPRIDWVIVGGESGGQARPMHPEWAAILRNQCAATGVAFHFKQWGEWIPRSMPVASDAEAVEVLAGVGKPRGWLTQMGQFDKISDQPGNGDELMLRGGKKHTGRLLDGVEHNGVPT